MIIYKILGWINIFIVMLMLMPIIIQRLNKNAYKDSNNVFVNLLKFLRKYHKLFGSVLFLSTIIHGIIALGGWYLHTGSILGIIVAVTVALGISFHYFKKKWIFISHKISSTILIVILLIHLIFPSALYYIFGT